VAVGLVRGYLNAGLGYDICLTAVACCGLLWLLVVASSFVVHVDQLIRLRMFCTHCLFYGFSGRPAAAGRHLSQAVRRARDTDFQVKVEHRLLYPLGAHCGPRSFRVDYFVR
jgi:hypothetical protein